MLLREFPARDRGGFVMVGAADPFAAADEERSAVMQAASELLPGQRAPTGEDETRRFLTRIIDVLRVFAACTLELQHVRALQAEELGVTWADPNDPLAALETPDEVLRYLLDWRDTGEKRSEELVRVFAGLVDHQRAYIHSALEAARSALNSLSPAEIERGAVTGWPGRAAALWRHYTTVYAALHSETHDHLDPLHSARPSSAPTPRPWLAPASPTTRPHDHDPRPLLAISFVSSRSSPPAAASAPCPYAPRPSSAASAPSRPTPACCRQRSGSACWSAVSTARPCSRPRIRYECSNRPVALEWPDEQSAAIDSRSAAKPLPPRPLTDADMTFGEGPDGQVLVWARITHFDDGTALGPVALARWVERGVEIRGIGTLWAPQRRARLRIEPLGEDAQLLVADGERCTSDDLKSCTHEIYLLPLVEQRFMQASLFVDDAAIGPARVVITERRATTLSDGWVRRSDVQRRLRLNGNTTVISEVIRIRLCDPTEPARAVPGGIPGRGEPPAGLARRPLHHQPQRLGGHALSLERHILSVGRPSTFLTTMSTPSSRAAGLAGRSEHVLEDLQVDRLGATDPPRRHQHLVDLVHRSLAGHPQAVAPQAVATIRQRILVLLDPRDRHQRPAIVLGLHKSVCARRNRARAREADPEHPHAPERVLRQHLARCARRSVRRCGRRAPRTLILRPDTS
jgi:hypothetical protein